MNVTFNKLSALRLLRALRRSVALGEMGLPRGCRRTSEISAPDPSPMKRWTKRTFDLSGIGLENQVGSDHPLYVAVGRAGDRIRMRYVRNTVYGASNGLPPESFIETPFGVSMSGPELLFAEAATLMDFPRLVMLGHELCGTFSRNPDNPRNGDAVFGVLPVTSVMRVKRFLYSARWMKNIGVAARAIRFVSENSWSPMEALISTVINLPKEECGYGLKPCTMNKRINAPDLLREAYDASSRVPDILLAGTHVGLNYDGQGHLDLRSIVGAAEAMGRIPDCLESRAALDAVVDSVRRKAVDDLRRNRQLAASGYIVLPVTKEDLRQSGGFDHVMLEAYEAVESFDGLDMSPEKQWIHECDCLVKRQRLIWSLMPNRQGSSSTAW